jgi:hypothetical protein
MPWCCSTKAECDGISLFEESVISTRFSAGLASLRRQTTVAAIYEAARRRRRRRRRREREFVKG